MAFRLFFFTIPSLLFCEIGFNTPWGKDTDLIYSKKISKEPEERYDVLSKAAKGVILFHQNVLSPVDGPRSHFRPTSSRYMLLSIKRYGFVKGALKGFDRLLRENNDPWVYRIKEINGITYKFDPTYN